MEEEQQLIPTLDEQFYKFSRLMDSKKDGTMMTLYLSDYWLRQAKIINDRRVTMTDTGTIWFKLCKTELSYEEWHTFISDLCNEKGLDQESVETALATCGQPGTVLVEVPEYKKFFDTYKPKNMLVNVPDSN